MSSSADQNDNRQLRLKRLVVVVLLLAAALWGVFVLAIPRRSTLMRQAKSAFRNRDYRGAIEKAERVLARWPEYDEAAVVAGDSCLALRDYKQAVRYYRRVPAGPSDHAVHARLKCAQISQEFFSDSEAAEEHYREVLAHRPDQREALVELARLLAIQARRTEAVPLILRSMRRDHVDVDFLGLLRTAGSAMDRPAVLQRWHRTTPNSPGVLVGLAWHARNAGQFEQAKHRLRHALRVDPDFKEARVALAEILWKTEQFEDLTSLLADEKTRELNDARLWVVRGRMALRTGQKPAAARCYWEAWRADPCNRTANFQLLRLTAQQEDQVVTDSLRRAIKQIQTLRDRFDVVLTESHDSLEPIQRLVDQLEEVGRLWEAWGWCIVARRIDSGARWPVTRGNVLRGELKRCPLSLVCRKPENRMLDLSHRPRPLWDHPSKTEPPSPKPRASPHVSFRDEAKAAGISFRYFNSPSPAGKGQRMYEFNGGGCGVLDYDRDGRPDLHFTQGCQWPVRESDATHLDRLYRNLGDGRFTDATTPARLFENRYSTGIAVGDFNSDGFPDVYVANIGRNRLFENNGDGTFRDVSTQALVDDPRWSTSCVIADLNGDALPDVYSVNYVTGKDVFERVCRHDDGHPRMCMPFHFPGDQDQLYLNLGDGRFANVTEKAGVTVANGKGLGVVAADWEGNGRLSLFVANDTVGNFLFVNRGPDQAGVPRFFERGLPAGVALNRDGKAEGCMGIAAGDANDDGTLDLFVTNFLNESNTLYVSRSGATFEDVTRESGLAEPSRKLLGFGTQFVDADLDGRLDLLVSNGHIDDYRRYGRPYQMPAQFFHNAGGGRFTELPAKRLGPYFRWKLLGRGMSRLDWNRDGREDAVISHLDEPAALLTNTTKSAGRFISIQLSGVQSSRDAIGTTVIVETQHRSITRQLTAGDGYQASNERVLVFGLEPSADIQRIIVNWPTGKREEFPLIEANRRYLIVEQSGELLRLP